MVAKTSEKKEFVLSVEKLVDDLKRSFYELLGNFEKEVNESIELARKKREELEKDIENMLNTPIDSRKVESGGDKTEESFEEMVEVPTDISQIKRGKVYNVEVVSIVGDDVFVEIIPGVEGKIKLDEFDEKPEVGQKVRAKVVKQDDEDVYILSIHAANREEAWGEVKRIAEEEKPLIVKIKTVRDRGAEGFYRGIKVFIPKSQLTDEVKVGDKVEGLITRLDERKKSIVLSPRALLDKKRGEKIGEMEEKVGEIFKVTVVGVNKGGIKVKFDEFMEGFIPKSEYSHSRLADHAAVKEGDEFEAKLIKVDGKKLILSKKQAEPDPWENASFSVGGVFKGKVVGHNQNGLFVEVKPGIVGFVHKSEIFWDRIPKNVGAEFNVGQEVDVKVIGVDVPNKKLSLSIKEAELSPWVRFSQQYSQGDVVTGKVVKLLDRGALIDVDGVTGLLAEINVSWDKRENWRDKVREGDEVKVLILKMDEENKKVEFSMKHLEEDPFVKFVESVKEGDKVEGEIVEIRDFGALVKLAKGVEGLLLNSELSWEASKKRVDDYYKIGDKVELVIKSLDKENRKIILSRRMLENNPWEKLENMVGEKVKCEYLRDNRAGVEVKVEGVGIVGFIPNVELSWTKSAGDAKKELKDKREFEAVIKEVDPSKNKFVLSLKQLMPNPWERLKEFKDEPVDVIVKSKKARELEVTLDVDGEEFVGYIPTSELEGEIDDYYAGETVHVVIVGIDERRRKFKASEKKATELLKKLTVEEKEETEDNPIAHALADAQVLELVEMKKQSKGKGRKKGKK